MPGTQGMQYLCSWNVVLCNAGGSAYDKYLAICSIATCSRKAMPKLGLRLVRYAEFMTLNDFTI